MTDNEMAAFIVTVITIGVLTLALITAWSKRRGASPTAEMKELIERLAKIEQAIDTIAVETERISEGQRFTTKLLSEKSPVRSEQR
jgi:hypothetical protein